MIKLTGKSVKNYNTKNTDKSWVKKMKTAGKKLNFKTLNKNYIITYS